MPILKAAILYFAIVFGIKHAEAFDITEYGRQPDQEELRRLVPF